MIDPSRKLRLQQLETNLNRVITRINEYEELLEDEKDPRERSSYRRQIQQLKDSQAEYKQEFEQLNAQSDDSSSAKTQEVAEKLQEIDFKIDNLSNLVVEGNTELRQALLARYMESEKNIVAKITEQLNYNQLDTVNAVLEALDNNNISQLEMQQFLTDVQQMLAELKQKNVPLPVNKQEIANVLNDPALAVRNRFKVSVPLIPFLLSYEGEVGLDTALNLKAAWKRLMQRFQQQSSI